MLCTCASTTPAAPPSPSAAAPCSIPGFSGACNSRPPASRECQLPDCTTSDKPTYEPTPAEQIDFLSRHFPTHGRATWRIPVVPDVSQIRRLVGGARLGIPEDLEDRLRRFESVGEFEQIVAEIRERHGTRRDARPTAEIKVPNGPVEYW